MATYSGTIDLRVTGNAEQKAELIKKRINDIKNIANSLKPVPNLFDKRGNDAILKAKEELKKLVEQYGKGTGTGNRFSNTIAGLNQQLNGFNRVLGNVNVKSDEFVQSLTASEKVSRRLARAEAERLQVLTRINTANTVGRATSVQETLDLGKIIPRSVAGLELYQRELQDTLRNVRIGSKDYQELARAIADVNRQLAVAQGRGPIQGPALPPGFNERGRIPGARRRGSRLQDIATGAGFPLLFGGGPLQALAGGVGGAFGGLGGAIAASAIVAQVEAFVQTQAQVGASIQESTNAFSALESAGFKVAGSLKAVVEQLEESGDAAGVYRIQQQELQNAYGENAVRDLSNFDRANQRLADSIERITSGVLPPILRLLTAITDISAGAINLFVDGVEAVRDAFRFIGGAPGATGDRARPDFRMEGGFAQASAFERSLVGMRDVDLEKRQKLIKDINRNQVANQRKIEQSRQKQLNIEQEFAKLEDERHKQNIRFLQQELALQSSIRQQRLAIFQAQARGQAAGLSARLRTAQGLAGLVGAGVETTPLRTLFKEIKEVRFAQINAEVQELGAVMGALNSSTEETISIVNNLRAVLAVLELRKLTDEFIDLQRAQMGLSDVPIFGGTSGLFSGDGVEFGSAISQAVGLQLELDKIIEKRPEITAVADAMATSFVNGLQAMVAGTKSAEEAFADFLMAIADALLQTAAQMIATYIAMGIARAFATGGSVGAPPSAEAQAAGLRAFQGPAVPFTGFAEGGYVSSPTRALIGEGSEPEYVIPESKMRESMARYSRGSRGPAVIPESGASGASGEGGGTAIATPIDVRYTVERINSVDYVTADQFQAGMQQAAAQGAKQGEQQTLKRLQMSGSTRKRIGI